MKNEYCSSCGKRGPVNSNNGTMSCANCNQDLASGLPDTKGEAYDDWEDRG